MHVRDRHLLGVYFMKSTFEVPSVKVSKCRPMRLAASFAQHRHLLSNLPKCQKCQSVKVSKCQKCQSVKVSKYGKRYQPRGASFHSKVESLVRAIAYSLRPPHDINRSIIAKSFKSITSARPGRAQAGAACYCTVGCTGAHASSLIVYFPVVVQVCNKTLDESVAP